MNWAVAKAIFVLPGTGVVLIPAVLLVLLGEALVFQSWPIAAWMVIFFIINAIYFPLVEEKSLERRFGEGYLLYQKNVPRWVPRLQPRTKGDEKRSETL
jgi:protein-S-isoprenylcysteine O-methyltransferase Ste14